MKSKNAQRWLDSIMISLVWGLLWTVLSGCDGNTKISTVHVNPDTMLTHGTALVTVDVTHPPSKLSDMKFEWAAQHGKFSPGLPSTPSRQYTAPEEPGEDTITVYLYLRDSVVDSKSVTLTVRGLDEKPPQAQHQTPESRKMSDKPSKPLEVDHKFIPAGWMGDGEEGQSRVRVNAASVEDPYSPPTCYKWTYVRPGNAGFAAVAWQYPEMNWGEKRGLDLTGYSKVTFQVRGERGGEQLMFKAGGHTKNGSPYPASFEAETDMITLTTRWQPVKIELTGLDLSNTVCAFVWVAKEMDNPDGCTFYLDDIRYEP